MNIIGILAEAKAAIDQIRLGLPACKNGLADPIAARVGFNSREFAGRDDPAARFGRVLAYLVIHHMMQAQKTAADRVGCQHHELRVFR